MASVVPILSAPATENVLPSESLGFSALVGSSYPDGPWCHRVNILVGSTQVSWAGEIVNLLGFRDVVKNFLYVEIESIKFVVEPTTPNMNVSGCLTHDSNIPAAPTNAQVLCNTSRFTYASGTTGLVSQTFELKWVEGTAHQIKPSPVHAFSPVLGFYVKGDSAYSGVVTICIYYKIRGIVLTNSLFNAPP